VKEEYVEPKVQQEDGPELTEREWMQKMIHETTISSLAARSAGRLSFWQAHRDRNRNSRWLVLADRLEELGR
jgi:hypothetical protein